MSSLQHIVFIIDGNRRWAKEKGKLAFFGHQRGMKVVTETALLCHEKNIPYITFWCLSTENLKERSKKELNFLFKLITKLPKEIEQLDKKGLRIRIIGDPTKLPTSCQKALTKVQDRTSRNNKATVTLAINYGGHDELVRAVQKILRQQKKPQDITEKSFSQFLDTEGIPDPDLIVRTGGKKRLSGLMSWQSAYAELYFADTYWPDFDETELEKALAYYHNTQRNFGK